MKFSLAVAEARDRVRKMQSLPHYRTEPGYASAVLQLEEALLADAEACGDKSEADGRREMVLILRRLVERQAAREACREASGSGAQLEALDLLSEVAQ